MNLAKYRKAQSDLDEAEERLEENAAELSLRSRLKNTMSGTATRAGGAVRPRYLLNVFYLLTYSLTYLLTYCDCVREAQMTDWFPLRIFYSLYLRVVARWCNA